jgi:hypothetical protein
MKTEWLTGAEAAALARADRYGRLPAGFEAASIYESIYSCEPWIMIRRIAVEMQRYPDRCFGKIEIHGGQIGDGWHRAVAAWIAGGAHFEILRTGKRTS